MLAICRALSLGRLAAAVVALALSGVVPAVEAYAEGEHAHRCQCRHGAGERCSCSACRRAAARARRAELDALPPCHRAAAEEALAREEREGPEGVDVMAGCCGGSEEGGALPGAPDPFVPPAPIPFRPEIRAEPVPSGGSAPRDVVRAPPTPPPRPA
jgi:hypothetical protein